MGSIKMEIKRIAKEYSRIKQLTNLYVDFKTVYEGVKNLSLQKEKLPSFFQSLHETTVDMRKKLLDDLARSESQRKKLEQEYDIVKEQGEKKSKTIIELIKKCQDSRNCVRQNPKDISSSIAEKYQKQIESLKNENKKNQEQNLKQLSIIKSLKLKQKDMQKQIEQLNELNNDQILRKEPYSPDHLGDRFFENDNYFKNFNESPNIMNLTQLQKTRIQPENDRRIRSFELPINNPAKNNELWTFIYLQASSIEQFLINSE